MTVSSSSREEHIFCLRIVKNLLIRRFYTVSTLTSVSTTIIKIIVNDSYETQGFSLVKQMQNEIFVFNVILITFFSHCVHTILPF